MSDCWATCGHRKRAPEVSGSRRPDIRIRTEDRTGSMDTLSRYDLSFITRKLISSKNSATYSKVEQLYVLEGLLGNVDESIARKLEDEFRRYMSLILRSERQQLAPSKAVDMYWHLFILDTERYRKFCFDVFGRFVDHEPSTDETKAHIAQAYSRTLSEYARAFKIIPDPKIWDKPQTEKL
jgi:hypothetical protein